MRKQKTEPVDDETIVALYFGRDETAIRYTEEKYGAYLYTIAENILHNRMDSEECVNDTYLGAWNAMPPEKPDVLRAFLAAIARRVSIGRYRNNHANKRVPSEFTVSVDELADCLGSGENPQESAVLQDIIRILNDYLHKLPDRDLSMFLCRYYCADSVNTIAKMFSVGDSAVRKELARLRKNLKTAIEKEGYSL